MDVSCTRLSISASPGTTTWRTALGLRFGEHLSAATTQTTTATHRIDALESLRGLMAMWVMFTHILPTAGIRWGQWPGILSELGEGIHAVNVFLILSGFVIFLLLDTAREDYGSFIARRFFRLFPAYALCLMASILLLDVNNIAFQQLPWVHPAKEFIAQTTADGRADLGAHIVAHLTLLHGVIPDHVLPSSAHTFLTQGWSLSLEWQFYLIAPIIFLLVSRRLINFIPLMVVAYLAHRYLYGDNAFLPTSIYYFLAGILSYYIWKYRAAVALPRGFWAVAVPAIVLATPLVTGSISLTIWATVFVSLLSLAAGNTGPVERGVRAVLEHKSAILLGRISYSVYLSHTVVITLVLVCVGTAAKALGQLGFLSLITVLVVPLTLALSLLLFHFVEQPGIRAGRRIAQPSLSFASP